MLNKIPRFSDGLGTFCFRAQVIVPAVENDLLLFGGEGLLLPVNVLYLDHSGLQARLDPEPLSPRCVALIIQDVVMHLFGCLAHRLRVYVTVAMQDMGSDIV